MGKAVLRKRGGGDLRKAWSVYRKLRESRGGGKREEENS